MRFRYSDIIWDGLPFEKLSSVLGKAASKGGFEDARVIFHHTGCCLTVPNLQYNFRIFIPEKG